MNVIGGKDYIGIYNLYRNCIQRDFWLIHKKTIVWLLKSGNKEINDWLSDCILGHNIEYLPNGDIWDTRNMICADTE